MVRRVAERSPEEPDSHIDAMVKIHVGVIWPKPSSYFLTRYNLASSFYEHSQNLKWLLPEKGFAIAIYYSCRVELTGTEIDLEGSEPDTTCAMVLSWHLILWADARCWAELPQKKLIIGGRTPARLVFFAITSKESSGNDPEMTGSEFTFDAVTAIETGPTH
jgi:hypothetical protein